MICSASSWTTQRTANTLNLTLPILRKHVLEIAREGIAGAGASVLVKRALDDQAVTRVLSGRVPLVIAAGKAARAMAATFFEAVPSAGRIGMVASPHCTDPVGSLASYAVSHPLPGAGSVAAGERALDIARGAGEDAALVVLLSGGASAALTVPIRGVTVSDKVAATAALLAGGVSIDGVNCVRKHLSAIKGGWLSAATRARVLTLAISDVVDPVPDDPTVIGSGPTTADPTTFTDALAVCRQAGVRETFPEAALMAVVRGQRGEFPETPKPGDPRLARSVLRVIGSRTDALEGAANAARRRGFAVAICDEPVTGEARAAGAAHVQVVAKLVHDMPRPACILSAGETTVRVVGQGHGGRNQEFALAAAPALARRFTQAVLASLGTDGIDGPTDAAGAVVDTTSLSRADACGLHVPSRYLDANNSYAFFDRVGGLVRTGPTDTNVGDLQVALIG